MIKKYYIKFNLGLPRTGCLLGKVPGVELGVNVYPVSRIQKLGVNMNTM